MAIMHFRVSHVSRSTGRSSVQSAAYITGEKLYDLRRDETVEYKRSQGSVYSWGVLAPENSPTEFKTLEGWNRLEQFEDEWANKYFKNPQALEHHKNNARISMTIIAALPRELTLDQSEELLKDFIDKAFVSKNHYVTYAIHNEEGNPHAHMMISHRFFDQKGNISEKKNRDLCTKSGIKQHRHLWADITNKHLEMHGHNQRVTASSYMDLGIDLIPTIHEGWYPQNLARQGELSFVAEANNQIREENRNKILENPMIVLDYMTRTNATFTMPQLLRKIEDFFPGNEKAVSYVYHSISENLVMLGEDVSTETRFTSKDYQEMELKAAETFNAIKDKSWGAPISELDIAKHIYYVNEQLVRESGDPTAQLNREQREAIQGICRNDQISVLVGRAGAGKTTSLRAVKAIYEEKGCSVIGAALSASAAKNLSDDTGCFSETIRFYIQKWESLDKAHAVLNAKGEEAKQWYEKEMKEAASTIHFYSKYELTNKSVFLVDEASMVGTLDWQKILERVEQRNAKLVIVGDGRQFSAIDAGDMHRYMEDNIRSESRFVLADINRQKVEFMRGASIDLSNQNIHTALATYENQGHVTPVARLENRDASYEHLYQTVAKDYVERLQESSNGVVLAYTNDACQEVNKCIRQELQARGVLSTIETKILGLSFTQGDRIVFLDNHRSNEGVKFIDITGQTPVDVTENHFIRNGTKGTVESIILKEREVEGEKIPYHQLTVKISENLIAKVDSDCFKPGSISHGYAPTTHKSQGQTLDWTLVVASKHMDSSAVYVAMTRHRYDMRVYYSNEDFDSFAKLQHSLGRASYKDMALDYTIQDQNQRYFNNVESYRLITMEMAALIANEDIYSDDEPKERMEVLEEQRKQYGLAILNEYDKHALYASQAKLTEQQIKIACGVEQRPLSRAEEEAKKRVLSYVKTAQDCRGQWDSLSKSGIGEAIYTHPNYLKYEDSKQLRDALALEIHLNKAIHKPFMREVGQSLGYGMSVIETQAKHALYRCDFKDKLSTLDLQIESYKEAANGVDIKVKEFWKTDAFVERGKAAMEITASHLHEKNEKLPKLTMLYAQSKELNFLEVRQNALDYNRLIFAKQIQDLNERQQAELVVAYDIIKRQAGRLYEECAAEMKEREKSLPLWETKGYKPYIEMKAIRDQIAQDLSKHELQSLQSISNLFGINISKLEEHHKIGKVQETPKTVDKNIERIMEAQVKYKKTISKEPITFESFKNQQLSLKEIESQLKDNIVPLAQELFMGEKLHSKTSNQIKFGRKGSKSVIIAGSRQGVYADFETGTKGNVFTMIQDRLGLSFKEALDWSQNWLGNPTREQLWESYKVSQKDQQKSVDEVRFVPTFPAPKEPVDIVTHKYLNYVLMGGKETMRHAYKDAENNVLGYVVRIEKEGTNNKATLPLTYCKDLKSGKSYWKWQGFGKEAPLYGLDQLAAKPNAPVLVMEGEKTADAARVQFPSYAVITWPGGASAASNANWSALKGRDIVMWPDNDKPGFAAAHKVKELCHKNGANTASIVRLPQGLPDKWDLADSYPRGLNQTKAQKLIDSTLKGAIEMKALRSEAISKLDKIVEANPLLEIPSNQIKDEALSTFTSIIQVCNEVGVKLSDKEQNHLLKQSLYMASRSQKLRQGEVESSNKLEGFAKAQQTALIEALYISQTKDLEIKIHSLSLKQVEGLRENFEGAVKQMSQSFKGHTNLPDELRPALAQDLVKIGNLNPALKDHMEKIVTLKIEKLLPHLNDITESAQRLENKYKGNSREQALCLVVSGMQTSETPQQSAHKIDVTLKNDGKENRLELQQIQVQQRIRGNTLTL